MHSQVFVGFAGIKETALSDGFFLGFCNLLPAFNQLDLIEPHSTLDVQKLQYLCSMGGNSYFGKSLYHRSLSVNDEGGTDEPFRSFAIHFLFTPRPISLSYLVIRVAEEDEGQFMLVPKLLVGGLAVPADSDYHSI